jgi:acyl carrier protein
MQKQFRFSQSDGTLSGNVPTKLASVFSDVFGLPPELVHPDLGPGDVERWDSVGHVMLVAAIEVEFSIQFDVDEIMEFTSFRAILSIIDRKMASSPGKMREERKVGT